MHYLTSNFNLMESNSNWDKLKKDKILSIGAVKIVNQEILLQETKEWFLPTNFKLNESSSIQ